MWRLVLSVLADAAFTIGRSFYTNASVPHLIEKSLDVMKQTVSPNDPAFAANSLVITLMPWVFALVLAIIWVPFLIRKVKESRAG